MPIKILCYASIVFLVMALFARPDDQFRAALTLFVFCATTIIIWNMVTEKKKRWVAMFGVIALLSNPLMLPLFNTSAMLAVDCAVLLGFLSFTFFETKARPTIASVVSVAPRSPSL
jgi:hypothetical protein